ncbi:MAG: SpoIIE family protein phosphatase [Deltaproteobacteria bacterium]|nr:SpoIIE family protein phosphatase [Deltaproteobacteria bacterium]
MLQPKSLQQRLSLYLILPVALLLILMGIAGFIYARNLMLSQWREASVLKLQRAAHQVDMRLTRVKDWIRIFHQTSGSQATDVLHDLAIEQLEKQEGVDQVQLIWNNNQAPSAAPSARRMSPRGRMFAGQPLGRADRPMRMRRFHSARIREITPPRFNDTIDHETVSLISDLNDENGQSVGRLEVVLNFDVLIKNVRESGWWQSNKAFLVSDGGKILTGTVPKKRDSLSESNDPVERETVEAMKTNAYGTILGEGHPPQEVSGFYKLQEAPWRLVMIAPGKAILAPIVNFRYYYFVTSAGFILIIVVLIRIVTGQTTAAIKEVSKAAERVAGGDYGKLLAAKTRDEVGELIRSFNTMVRQLKERMEMKQAMNLAMEVQQNLLPKEMPIIKGLDIAARSIYCDETGGDLYDFLEVENRNADCIGIAVGDVSGHGIPAALLMATVRAFLKSRVTQPGSAVEIISDVNRLVTHDTGETGQFMTLFYAAIDTAKKKLRWVRAGHDPGFFYDPVADSFAELGGQGMAIGVDGGYTYREGGTIDLSAGQIFLIGTDGLWETQNKSGEMFGKNRLEAVIRQYAKTSADTILRSIIHAVQEFRASAKQEDDITLAVIKVVD